MSVTVDGAVVALDFETDPAHLNMANGNARSFLELLDLEPGDDLYGEVTLPEARRGEAWRGVDLLGLRCRATANTMKSLCGG